MTRIESCEDVSAIVEALVSSYEELGGINHLEGVNLPDRQTVAQITDDLLRLVFPGFYEDHELRPGTVRYYIGERISRVLDRLTEEVAKSLKIRDESNGGPEEARKVVCIFLHSLPDIRAMLAKDVAAAFEGDPAAKSHDEIILAYPGLEAIAVQRMAHFLYEKEIPIIPRMMTELAHSRTGIDIHPGATIGESFFIDHGTGVVIGETTDIGNRVKIYQGVTLGALSTKGGQGLRGKKRHPTIEDDVTIYAGATILGGETTVGSGSIIGGNVWLLQSVPPLSLVTYENGETRTSTLVRFADLGAGI